jgi:putative IMPACT (imprinted ancient) family translation regulator
MKNSKTITEESLNTGLSLDNFPKGSIDNHMSSVLKTEPSVADVEHFFLKMR